jgi:glycosyltransferase involved in cell wall biosynthesis
LKPAAKDKKILLYTDSHTQCGVGQFNLALLDALVAGGYQTAYFQRRENSPALKELEQRGLTMFWLEGNPEDAAVVYANDRRLPGRVFLDFNPDLIYFSNGTPLLGSAATHTAKYFGFPYMICEGLVTPNLLESDQAATEIVGAHYESSRSVVCVSQQNLDLMKNHYRLSGENLSVIPSGAREQFFVPKSAGVARRVRDRLRIPADAIVCLTVAKFGPVKGHDILLQAINQLRQSAIWDRLHFLWAGDGPTKETILQNVPSDKVTAVAFCDEVWELLDASDIFVLPSRSEGLPRTIVEAMAKGLGIVATDVGGTSEALDDTGLLIPSPVEDAQITAAALSRSIDQLAEDERLRQNLGTKAAARARKLYRGDQEIAAHMEKIEQILFNQAAD